ncbi:MAG: JAB domain-containing protein, partial [Lysobacterales bacterium]
MKAIVKKTKQKDRFSGLKPGALNDAEKCSLLALAMKVLSVRHYRGRILKSPDDTQAYLRLRLADKQTELFGCLYLDNRHRVLELCELFHGRFRNPLPVEHALDRERARCVGGGVPR